MSNLEKQVEDLVAQVEVLKCENSSLSNKNDLLTKVLQLKDQQMCVLQEEAKVCVLPVDVFSCCVACEDCFGKLSPQLHPVRCLCQAKLSSHLLIFVVVLRGRVGQIGLVLDWLGKWHCTS